MSDVQGAFRLPFNEQLAFFRQKLNLPTTAYDDLLAQHHDRAFVVAGAMKADLLADLRGAIDQAMAEGKSLQWFRQEFGRIVERRGWTGWTGEGSKGGEAWRTRVIFHTNLNAAHAAGRYAQLTEPGMLRRRPYWRYVHRSVENPRHHHKAWHGLVLRADDPWWASHYPPNGFGCQCIIEAVNERELTRLGKSGPDSAPPSPLVEHVNRATGEVIKVPQGIQPGWDTAPGAGATATALAVQADKLGRLEPALARAHVAELVASPLFGRFVRGQLAGEFPVAVLAEADRAWLGSASPVVVLTRQGVKAGADITLSDYRRLPDIVAQGEVWQVPGRTERLIFITLGGVRYRAVLLLPEIRLHRDDGPPPAGAVRLR